MGKGEFNNYHIAQSLPWVDIFIDRYNPRVRLVQKWKYVWDSNYIKGSSFDWQDDEKAKFHIAAERIVREAWSRKATLSVSGTSDYADRYRMREIMIDVRIKPVEADPHWTVEVYKGGNDVFNPPRVYWNGRRMFLNDSNTNAVEQVSEFNHPGTAESTITQHPIAHEFGHLMHNVGSDTFPQNLKTQYVEGDEYQPRSPHYKDEKSIMNIGNQIRGRHFDGVVDALNLMIPNTTFAIKNIK